MRTGRRGRRVGLRRRPLLLTPQRQLRADLTHLAHGAPLQPGRLDVEGVVVGDRRLDMTRVRELYGCTDAAFAAREVAERLSGCVSGCVVPFTFDPDLELVVDTALLDNDWIYFNAARLDLSIALPVPA
ncbi:YbaK/EbsC family protein [Streptomyces sp. NPDC001816]|uniref:YbaK/EbsC family protein n=1 Tax=Streptomyces sp. NPDC001816 TaxID=3364612 RepID=UPI0036C19AA8